MESNTEPITEVQEVRDTHEDQEDTIEAENTYEMEGVLPYLTMRHSHNKSNLRFELKKII